MSKITLKSLELHKTGLKDINSFYTASNISKSVATINPTQQSHTKSLPKFSISSKEDEMALYKQVFINSKPISKPNVYKPVQLMKKTRPTDFFYQLLAANAPELNLELKDMLCIAELGIPEGDFQKEATIFLAIGDKYEKLNKCLSAIKFYKRALKANKILKDNVGKSISLNRLGIAYYNRGNFSKAKKMHIKHQKICKQDFIPYYNLGVVARAMKRFPDSCRYLLEALTISEDKDKEKLCIAYAQLGLTYKAMNEFELAKHKLLQAAKISKAIKADGIMVEIKIALAYLSFHSGQTQDSEKHFLSSMWLSIGEKSDICRINIGIIRGENHLKSVYPLYSTVKT
jgi:tetratricopeptide (TPR) repeat protein